MYTITRLKKNEVKKYNNYNTQNITIILYKYEVSVDI